MKEQPFVVAERAGSYDVWKPCADPACTTYHHVLCTCRDRFDAEAIVQAMGGRLR